MKGRNVRVIKNQIVAWVTPDPEPNPVKRNALTTASANPCAPNTIPRIPGEQALQLNIHSPSITGAEANVAPVEKALGLLCGL